MSVVAHTGKESLRNPFIVLCVGLLVGKKVAQAHKQVGLEAVLGVN